MNPYYQDDWCTIYHGDCYRILGQIAKDPNLGITGETDGIVDPFDLGFADPPYNYAIDYDGYDDAKPAEVYEAWCGRWFDRLMPLCARVAITPGHGNLAQWLNRRKPAGIAAWYKPGNPAGAGIFQFCEWEPVLIYGSGRIGGSDVWKATINPDFKGPTGHPCPKPELLLRRIIAATKATSVLDPFMGSGTTLVAAKSMNVKAVGIEQSERYCEIAATRLAQEVLDFGGAA